VPADYYAETNHPSSYQPDTLPESSHWVSQPDRIHCWPWQGDATRVTAEGLKEGNPAQRVRRDSHCMPARHRPMLPDLDLLTSGKEAGCDGGGVMPASPACAGDQEDQERAAHNGAAGSHPRTRCRTGRA